MPKPTNSIYGAIVVSRWELKQGETIPLHNHEDRPLSKHITVVLSGQIRINYPDLDMSEDFGPATLIDFHPDREKHEIVALTDAVFLNVFKETL